MLDADTDFTIATGDLVGPELRRLRKAAGMTQLQVALRSGMHRPIVARIEAGRHAPDIATIKRYCSAVGQPMRVVLEHVDAHEIDVAPFSSRWRRRVTGEAAA